MKKLHLPILFPFPFPFPFLFLFLFPLLSSAQRSDTTWWSKPSSIRYIIDKNEHIVTIRCWHQNGTVMTSGKFRIDHSYIPMTDVVVLDPNGKKVQEYIFETGTLINYFPDGAVKDSLHSPLHETSQHFIEYYISGLVKKRWNSRKDSAKNGIVFFPYSSNEPGYAFMYQQTGFAWTLFEEFYPSGNIYHRIVYDPKILYNQTWYTAGGEVDKSSYLGATNTGHQLIKQGQRLEWWNNGNLKSQQNYRDDHEEGSQRHWHENGQPHSEKFIKDASLDSITRVWYPGGQLQYYSDCRYKIERKPALSFFPNGNVERMEMAITNTYDSTGRMTFESFSTGYYNRYFDFNKGTPNRNRYEGLFDKIRIGKWKSFDEKGRLMYVTFYKDGLTEGETIIYDTLGRLISRANYHQGRLHGLSLVMHQNGKDTLSYGAYFFGRATGIWRRFFPNGKLESVVQYHDNNYNYDELLKYNEKGQLIVETVLDGKGKKQIRNQYDNKKLSASYIRYLDKDWTDSYEYFPNGKLRRTIIHQRDGSEVEKKWFENGKREMVTQRKNNKAFGRFVMWWPNGNKRYEGMMRDGIRDGEWAYYNEDGSIASHPYFEKGVEVVMRPQNISCFCNKIYPPLKSTFMQSAETLLSLRDVNRIMTRFQLDTGYNAAFIGCMNCRPVPMYVFKDIGLKIGKDGMYLNFTPCRHGHNYGMIEVNPRYTKPNSGYEYDKHDSDMLKPPLLYEAVGRTMEIIESWDDPFLYSTALAEISGDPDQFKNFLKKNYNIEFNGKIETGESEMLALEMALDAYEKNDKDGRVSFDADLAKKLSALLLQLFPPQAAVLKKKPADRDAINHIIENFFGVDLDRLGPELYGALSVGIDSGNVSLVLPTTFITAYDKLKGKPVLKNGKPAPASFFISFRTAQYESYPQDELIIYPENSYNHCAQEFAIGKKGAWMRPLDFQFYFQKHRRHYNELFDVYNYPFHYKKPETKIGEGPANIEVDDYISNFMGVIVKSGELNLPGTAPVTVNDMLLDGKELNGYIRLPGHDPNFTKEELQKALMAAGFSVMPGEAESSEETILYIQSK